MKLHRFFGNFDFSQTQIRIRDQALLNQWRNVLKFRVGETVILCNGLGNEVEARFQTLSRETALLELGKPYANPVEPKREVTLYGAVLKKENFEWLVQKAVEAGVRKVVPIVTARTVKLKVVRERLQKISQEAAEQSGRGLIPLIAEPIAFEAACAESLVYNQMTLMCDTQGQSLSRETLSERLGIFIGPEGGWEEEELQSAHNKGFKLVSLGDLVLKAETAAVISAYLAVHA